jgi:hypothetical protein
MLAAEITKEEKRRIKMRTVDEIYVGDFVTQYAKVWDGMIVAETEEEFAEAKKYLFAWFDAIHAADADIRKAVFAQTR